MRLDPRVVELTNEIEVKGRENEVLLEMLSENRDLVDGDKPRSPPLSFC